MMYPNQDDSHEPTEAVIVRAYAPLTNVRQLYRAPAVIERIGFIADGETVGDVGLLVGNTKKGNMFDSEQSSGCWP
jgi:hypothetical protein